jgi:integrase
VLHRLNAGRSPYTLRRDVSVLRSALRKALRWRLIAKDPLEGMSAKAREVRHIPINDKAFAPLSPAGNGRVFPIAISSLNRIWRRVLKDAGIEAFRFHDMRHDFASLLVMAGADLNVLRALLGQSDLRRSTCCAVSGRCIAIPCRCSLTAVVA